MLKKTFATMLKEIRTKQNLTQREFAITLGIATQQLSHVENGATGISPRKAKEYAIKLGESPEVFVKQVILDMLEKEGMRLEVLVPKGLVQKGEPKTFWEIKLSQ